LSDKELETILSFLKLEVQHFFAAVHNFLFTLKHAVPSLNLTVR
jgi:hypothetical protein